MGLIDLLPANGETPAPAAPASSAGSSMGSSPPRSGGIVDLLPSNLPADASAIHKTLPPASNGPDQFFANRAGVTQWQPAQEKDQSGLPYLSFKPKQVATPPVVNKQGTGTPDFSKMTLEPGTASPQYSPGDNGFITDHTRVATTFDPRVAHKLERGSFTTPRALANRAALKSSMGGTYNDELDHAIALELAGSNDESNLQIEKNVPGTKNTATDPLENQLAKEVVSGQKSLFQAQWDLAKTKGRPLPYLGDSIDKYEQLAYDSKKASDYANSPLGIAENSAGMIGHYATAIASTLFQHVKAAVSTPQGALHTGEGVVQTAVVKPAAFIEGMGAFFVNQTADRALNAMGVPSHLDASQGVYHQLSDMSKDIDRTPDEQKAYDTGQFVGWMVPFSKVSQAVNGAVDAVGIAAMAPKMAPLIPYISDAAAFLGTGQIMHDPADGSRVNQLKNDAIALALFDVGGFVLKGGATLAAKGLSNLLPAAARDTASEALKPVVDALKAGTPVSADELDAATSRANAAIEEATGKRPQALLQEHVGLKTFDVPEKPEPAATPVYFGTGNNDAYDPARVTEKGISVATTRDSAEFFAGPNVGISGKGEGYVQELHLAPGAKVMKYEDFTPGQKAGFASLNRGGTTDAEEQAVVDYARSHGYDAVDLTPWGEDEIRVINPKVLAHPENPKLKNALDSFATSGGDWDPAIKAGDISKEQIYQKGGAFTPDAAKHVVSDLAGKMNSHVERGVGDEFLKTVDMSNPTRENLIAQANKFAESKLAAATDAGAASRTLSPKELPQFVDTYIQKNGNVINTDDARELFPEYMADRTKSSDVHERASQVAKAAYDRLLEDRKGAGNNTVIFTAGGTGAGKTTALNSAGVDLKDYAIVYDGNMNKADSALGKINKALDNGFDVEVHYIHNDINTALENALQRAEGQAKKFGSGRTVPIIEHVNTHTGAVETFEVLHTTLNDDERVSFHLINNEQNMQAGFVENPIAFLANRKYNKGHEEIAQDLSKQVDEAHAAGRISDQTRTGFLEGDHSAVGQEGQGQAASTGIGNEPQNGAGTGEPRKAITLPELPEQNTLYGTAFPGANAVAKFVEKDVIGSFASARDAVKGIYDAGKNLFTVNPVREKAAAVVGASIQTVEQYSSAAWKAAEGRRDWWAKLPSDTQIDFITQIQRGASEEPGVFEGYAEEMQQTMKDLAKEARDRLDAAYQREQSAGIENNYLDNYFPGMWQKPDQARQAFQDYFFKFKTFGTNYREAFGGFTGKKVLDLMQIGIDMGLKPVTTNPEEIVLMREVDGARAVAKATMMRDLERGGLAAKAEGMFDPNVRGMPIIRGPDDQWWGVVPEAKKILDNAFFSKNLWSEPGLGGALFRNFMAVKGTVVPFQLSLSGFHPFHVQTIATASTMTDAFMEMLNGNMSAAEGMKEMGKGLSMASTGSDLYNYWNVGKWWDTPMDQLAKTHGEEAATTVRWLIDAGGSPKISEEFKIRGNDGFKGALEDQNYIGAAIRGFPKLVEGLQKPIFEYYVPALKVASFMRAATNAVKDNPTLLTDDLARKTAFRDIWGDMDSRFGEMVYKTKFWNPMLTQVGEASFLSLGWQAGFVDQFMGGALDMAKLGKLIATGQATRSDVSSRMVFSVVYTMQAAMWGGLMTYAMSGEKPKTLQDFFYPRTGDTNADGSPARLNTPFYTREYFGLMNHIRKEGLVGGPIGMIENKANPILTSLASIYNNKDYYGYEIRDTNSAVSEQAAQLFKYVVENNAIPISIKGAQQAYPVSGKLGATASIMGFNPAPKYISETSIESKIYATLDKRNDGTRALDSKPVSTAKANIRKLYEKGDVDGANKALDAAIQAGYIKEKGAGTFIKSLDLPGDVRAFESLAQSPSDQEALLKQMNAEELARYAQYASSDVKAHLSSLSPAAKQFVDDLHAGKVQLVQFKAGKPVKESDSQ